MLILKLLQLHTPDFYSTRVLFANSVYVLFSFRMLKDINSRMCGNLGESIIEKLNKAEIHIALMLTAAILTVFLTQHVYRRYNHRTNNVVRNPSTVYIH